MPTRHVDQLALDEQRIDDEELESALEYRERKRIAASEARKAFDEAHEKANVEIAKLELPEDTAVRSGRFRITRSAVPARSVAFDAKATTRIRITLLGE